MLSISYFDGKALKIIFKTEIKGEITNFTSKDGPIFLLYLQKAKQILLFMINCEGHGKAKVMQLELNNEKEMILGEICTNEFSMMPSILVSKDTGEANCNLDASCLSPKLQLTCADQYRGDLPDLLKANRHFLLYSFSNSKNHSNWLEIPHNFANIAASAASQVHHESNSIRYFLGTKYEQILLFQNHQLLSAIRVNAIPSSMYVTFSILLPNSDLQQVKEIR